MYQTINCPMEKNALREYESIPAFRAELTKYGCDGLETVWSGEPVPDDLPTELIVGYHLTFYPDWLDFYREDTAALIRKFGSIQTAKQFYGCQGREGLMDQYRADLERASSLNARYVVFHVSDVSLEEGYTYRWLHTHEEVIDASAEIINDLLGSRNWPFEFLVENQWWPGLTFTEPKLTERLLNSIHYKKTGIMLDTGHLMNTCPSLRTQAEGAAYIQKMLRQHGSLARAIRGVHLHQSLSGQYVQTHTGKLPEDLPEDYIARFSKNYSHILQIDRHQPWTDPAICPILEQIHPEYLTHELAAGSLAQRMDAVKIQASTLKCGGFTIAHFSGL
ncbi:MAG: TIM barrel protein [Clostridiales bacterium]|nr:TIM barrel protein [Clostridiales bacterium]